MEVMSLIVVVSALVIYWDCTRNHIGKIPNEKSMANNSAGIWAIGTCLLWIIVLPLYMINRKKLKQKAVESPQVVSHFKRTLVLGFFLLMSALTVAVQFSNIMPLDRSGLLTDVSGVWQGTDGTIVTIDFENIANKTLQIQDEVFPVTIEQVDQDNNIVVLTLILNGEKDVWSIQKNIQADESFFLQVTLSDGKQHNLAFIRNIL